MAKKFKEESEFNGMPVGIYFGKKLLEFENNEVELIKFRETIKAMRAINTANRSALLAMLNKVYD